MFRYYCWVLYESIIFLKVKEEVRLVSAHTKPLFSTFIFVGRTDADFNGLARSECSELTQQLCPVFILKWSNHSNSTTQKPDVSLRSKQQGMSSKPRMCLLNWQISDLHIILSWHMKTHAQTDRFHIQDISVGLTVELKVITFQFLLFFQQPMKVSVITDATQFHGHTINNVSSFNSIKNTHC